MKALEKRHRALFEQMLDTPSLTPTLTIAKALAFIMAMLVHATTVLFAFLGIYFFIIAASSRDIDIILFAVFGLICFFGVWSVAPRFLFKHPDGVIPRADFPRLYGLADSVAANLKVPPIDGILLTDAYNAWIFRV